MSVIENLGRLFISRQLKASQGSFLSNISSGALIAALSDPFAGQGLGTTSYATYGTVPGQLVLSGSNINAGASAAVGGSSYSIGVEAISGDGKRRVGETLTFAAQNALGPTIATFVSGATAGTLIVSLTGVPTGIAATFTPTSGSDAGKVAVAGTGATSQLVVGLTAASTGTIGGTLSAVGAASASIAITVATATASPALLLENGAYLLLESGSKILLEA